MTDLAQIAIGFLLSLAAGGTGSVLTYYIGVQRTFEERKRQKRIRTYRELMGLVDLTIDGVEKGRIDKANEKLCEIQNLLLLYAPDEVYRAHATAIEKALA